jgi:hypothetical protein
VVCLKSALVRQTTVELYCDFEGLQAPARGSILIDILAQAQRLDFVIFDWLVHGLYRIALVELTCPWNSIAKKAKECKASRYADLKIALSNQRGDCSLYLIKVGVNDHSLKPAFVILGLVPCGPQIRYCADDQACQLAFPFVFVFYILGSQ